MATKGKSLEQQEVDLKRRLDNIATRKQIAALKAKLKTGKK